MKSRTGLKLCTGVILVNIRVQLLTGNTVVLLLSILKKNSLETQDTNLAKHASSFLAHQETATLKAVMQMPSAHPTQVAALPQHLVSFEQVVSHQLADFVLSFPASLDHLHLCFCRRLPLKVFFIWGRRQSGLSSGVTNWANGATQLAVSIVLMRTLLPINSHEPFFVFVLLH